VRDEGFYLFTRGIAKGFYRTEIGGIGLDQVGIELMLADDLGRVDRGRYGPFRSR